MDISSALTVSPQFLLVMNRDELLRRLPGAQVLRILPAGSALFEEEVREMYEAMVDSGPWTAHPPIQDIPPFIIKTLQGREAVLYRVDNEHDALSNYFSSPVSERGSNYPTAAHLGLYLRAGKRPLPENDPTYFQSGTAVDQTEIRF